MGNTVIALLVSLSATVWIYNKLMRSTGSNTKNSIIVAVTLAVCIFGIVLLLLGLIPS